MLKRFFYSIIIAGLFPALVAAQEPGPHEKAGEQQTLVERLTHGKTSVENAEMNFQIFTTANAEFRDREFEGANFKLNRVRMEIKGDVGKYLTYYYRQSFNKYMDPFSLDNLSSSLELACVNLNLSDRLSITAGKHFLVLGGYEYYVNAIKVREFSEFNEMISCYQAGVTANWQITPTQELCVQVMNNRSGSDDEIYQTGLPLGVESAKVPFFYSANWNSFYAERAIQLRYAASLAQVAQGYSAFYFTCGNIYERGPWIAYLDLMYTKQQLDQHGIISHLPAEPSMAPHTEYFTAIGNVDYRFHPRWNGYVKGAYETARVYKGSERFEKGRYRRSWNVQACLEFFPFPKIDLFVFGLYSFRGVALSDRAVAMGATAYDRHRVSLGLVYSIPVF